MAACEALTPHLLHVARATADPAKLVPIGYWMHRGGVPFVSPEIFRNVYWATVKPIIEDLWADGHQTLFYAEGNWDRHLESFAELPDASIVYHVDRGDLALTHRVLGEKFCISGGLSNTLLATGTPEQVRARCKEIIEIAAKDGGYIMDASAIVQNDASVANFRAMTEATREFGVYSSGSLDDLPDVPGPNADHPAMPRHPAAKSGLPPGVCFPWDEKRPELPRVGGDPALLKNVWESVDGLPYVFIWQVLLSF
jgi:hypothetical protein